MSDDKILALSKMRAFADDNLNVAQMVQTFSDMVINIVGKKRNCWSPAFSPFSTMFSKSLYIPGSGLYSKVLDTNH